jgi:uncharacterized protein
VTSNAAYLGHVLHKRLRPFRHRFVYRVFSLLLDLDDLPTQLRFFKHNRFGLLSLYDKDHGARDGSALRPWAEQHLRAAGYEPQGWKILLACYPRLWGYVFNPLSVYYCYDPAGLLQAILYEVKNTFGDQHGYLLKAGDRQDCSKGFYVSPFIGMTGHYNFKLNDPSEELLQHIQMSDEVGPLLVATYRAQRQPLTDAAILRLILTHPLMTFKVFAAIHWEALRLWLKGAKYHSYREPPQRPVTYIATTKA